MQILSSFLSYPLSLMPALLAITAASFSHSHSPPQGPLHFSPDHDPIPHSNRVFWMRRAISALSSPCPFAAFGAAIVNHTATHSADGELGELVCIGANSVMGQGNPSLHGKFSMI